MSNNNFLDQNMLQQLENKLSGEFQKDLNLSKYNTWHVGGKADYIYKPSSLEDLQLCFKSLYYTNSNINIYWFGLGSNVLIRDGGLRGLVILTNLGKDNGLNNLSLINKDNNFSYINVGAGIPCAKLAKFTADNDAPNGAFWAGIPGTMGGALAMNAGCYGHETWDYIESVQVINRQGKIFTLKPSDFEINYRSIDCNNITGLGKDCWFISTNLKLPINTNVSGRGEIKKLLQKRNTSQPIGLFTGGSVFKNPKGDFSARLIEEAGLKGHKIGGAQVSLKHANFIVNDKTGTAGNIEQLISHIQDIVLQKFGVMLEPEVKIIGEPL